MLYMDMLRFLTDHGAPEYKKGGSPAAEQGEAAISALYGWIWDVPL